MKTTTITAIAFITLMIAFLACVGYALVTKDPALGFFTFIATAVCTALLIAVNAEVE